MSVVATPLPAVKQLPDHLQLPESDGLPVENFNEHPQSILLTDSLGPVLMRLHPDEQYAIGQNSGIYWKLTDPPLDGCRAPDWFYVPDVPPRLGGTYRRSYVLWQERAAPLVLLEFSSGDGREELDRTPERGKFWVYERAVHASYYGVFILATNELRMFRLVDGRFVRMEPNERGRYPIPALGVELGIWFGRYQNHEDYWLRWWDLEGNLLPTGGERADHERALREQAQRQAEQAQRQAEQAQRQAEQAQRQAEEERQARARLAARLRELGVDPDTI